MMVTGIFKHDCNVIVALLFEDAYYDPLGYGAVY